MSFSTLAAGADGKRGDVEREWNIGVGGSAVEMGADAEMSIDGAEIGQNRRAFGELPSGTRSDLLEFGRDFAAGGAFILDILRPFDGGGQELDQIVHLLITF